MTEQEMTREIPSNLKDLVMHPFLSESVISQSKMNKI